MWKEHDGLNFSVVNFTDDGPFTRETAWHRIPHHLQDDTGRATITREEPCDYRDNGLERYYPVKTVDGANEAFAPSEQAVEDARGILQAWEDGEGSGVVTYNGRMIENLHVESARRTLSIHEAISAMSA